MSGYYFRLINFFQRTALKNDAIFSFMVFESFTIYSRQSCKGVTVFQANVINLIHCTFLSTAKLLYLNVVNVQCSASIKDIVRKVNEVA